MQISFSITWRNSFNNLWIADLAIFREWINNHHAAGDYHAVTSWNRKLFPSVFYRYKVRLSENCRTSAGFCVD